MPDAAAQGVRQSPGPTPLEVNIEELGSAPRNVAGAISVYRLDALSDVFDGTVDWELAAWLFGMPDLSDGGGDWLLRRVGLAADRPALATATLDGDLLVRSPTSDAGVAFLDVVGSAEPVRLGDTPFDRARANGRVWIHRGPEHVWYIEAAREDVESMLSAHRASPLHLGQRFSDDPAFAALTTQLPDASSVVAFAPATTTRAALGAASSPFSLASQFGAVAAGVHANADGARVRVIAEHQPAFGASIVDLFRSRDTTVYGELPFRPSMLIHAAFDPGLFSVAGSYLGGANTNFAWIPELLEVLGGHAINDPKLFREELLTGDIVLVQTLDHPDAFAVGVGVTDVDDGWAVVEATWGAGPESERVVLDGGQEAVRLGDTNIHAYVRGGHVWIAHPAGETFAFDWASNAAAFDAAIPSPLQAAASQAVFHLDGAGSASLTANDGFAVVDATMQRSLVVELARPRITTFVQRSATMQATRSLYEMYSGTLDAFYGASAPRAFLASAPMTPPQSAVADACAEGRALTDDDWVPHATWEALDFAPSHDRLLYSYQYDSQGSGVGATFTASAFGDLDCDGHFSTYVRFGRTDDGELVTGSPGIYIASELE